MKRKATRRRNQERGVTYLFVMLAVVLMGISVTVAAKQWKAVVQREHEAELLARGIEIQSAIAMYSAAMKKGRVVPGEIYPPTLEELTKPSKPFLRKAYQDPITGGEWEYVLGPAGGIKGVKSKSKAEPFKQSNFPTSVRHFEGLASYDQWVFQYPNPSMTPTVPQTPPAAPAQPTPTTPATGAPAPTPPASIGVTP